VTPTVIWLTIGGLAVGTIVIKAFAPVALGGRELPRQANAVIALLAPALLAALVMAQTITAEGGGLALDQARIAGVAAAALALAARAPLLAVVAIAAAATALVRMLA
jgi:branched-subunit amino acid transport protein